MMKRLLVKTQERDRSQSRIWNVSDPLPLGYPVSCVLVNSETGVRILDLRGKEGVLENKRVDFVSFAEIRDGNAEKVFDLDEQSIAISIRECSSVRAAHFTNNLRLRLKAGIAHLWVYSGVHKAVGASLPVRGAYIGYYSLKPLFIAYPSEQALRLKVLGHGLVIKERGKPSQELPPKTTCEFSLSPGHYVTLRRRMHWWKFQFVGVPTHTAQKIAARSPPSEEESKWVRSLAAVFCLILLFLMGIELFVKEDATTSSPASQEVKVASRKAKDTRNAFRSAPSQGNPRGAKAIPATEKAIEPVITQEQSPVPEPENSKPHPKLSQGQKANQEAIRNTDLLRKALLGSKLAAKPEPKTQAISPENAIASGLMRRNASVAEELPVSAAIEVKREESIEKIGSKAPAGKKTGESYDSVESASNGTSKRKNSFMNISGAGSAVEEGLSRDEVAGVIRGHMNEVRYCHEASLIRNPKLAGRIILHFVIGKEGTIKTAKEESTTLIDPQLSSCILRRLESWKFPKPRGGVDVSVSFPFLFKVLDGE